MERRLNAPLRRVGPLAAGLVAVAWLATGCKPTQFEAAPDIPMPLIDRIPVVVGVHVPQEFRDKVYEEKRDGTKYAITLGKAQADGFMRMMQAMFERVVVLDTPADAAKADPAIRGVLEPVLNDYAFVTPTDSGGGVYAASLKYTINLYKPTGELADSWTFTGYGTEAGSVIPGKGDEALRTATSRAMRDAAAKLAAEFREQAIARGLLPAAIPGAPAEVETPSP